jgi:hypothetical protein
MELGRADQFNWIESSAFDLGKLLKDCPEVVLGEVTTGR